MEAVTSSVVTSQNASNATSPPPGGRDENLAKIEILVLALILALAVVGNSMVLLVLACRSVSLSLSHLCFFYSLELPPFPSLSLSHSLFPSISLSIFFSPVSLFISFSPVSLSPSLPSLLCLVCLISRCLLSLFLSLALSLSVSLSVRLSLIWLFPCCPLCVLHWSGWIKDEATTAEVTSRESQGVFLCPSLSLSRSFFLSPPSFSLSRSISFFLSPPSLSLSLFLSLSLSFFLSFFHSLFLFLTFFLPLLSLSLALFLSVFLSLSLSFSVSLPHHSIFLCFSLSSDCSVLTALDACSVPVSEANSICDDRAQHSGSLPP